MFAYSHIPVLDHYEFLSQNMLSPTSANYFSFHPAIIDGDSSFNHVMVDSAHGE